MKKILLVLFLTSFGSSVKASAFVGFARSLRPLQLGWGTGIFATNAVNGFNLEKPLWRPSPVSGTFTFEN